MRTPEQIAAEFDFGKPSAAKRGRRKEWPYVPVIDYGPQEVGAHRTRTMQIKGLAYATREEAVDRAAKHIEACRRDLAEKLRNPRYRALRLQHGLPQEAADLEMPSESTQGQSGQATMRRRAGVRVGEVGHAQGPPRAGAGYPGTSHY